MKFEELNRKLINQGLEEMQAQRDRLADNVIWADNQTYAEIYDFIIQRFKEEGLEIYNPHYNLITISKHHIKIRCYTCIGKISYDVRLEECATGNKRFYIDADLRQIGVPKDFHHPFHKRLSAFKTEQSFVKVVEELNCLLWRQANGITISSKFLD